MSGKEKKKRREERGEIRELVEKRETIHILLACLKYRPFPLQKKSLKKTGKNFKKKFKEGRQFSGWP